MWLAISSTPPPPPPTHTHTHTQYNEIPHPLNYNPNWIPARLHLSGEYTFYVKGDGACTLDFHNGDKWISPLAHCRRQNGAHTKPYFWWDHQQSTPVLLKKGGRYRYHFKYVNHTCQHRPPSSKWRQKS